MQVSGRHQHSTTKPAETEKVEEYQHLLMCEEDSDSDNDGHFRPYPSFNPKATGTSSAADKARESLRYENQQLFALKHLPHSPQTTPPGADMTDRKSVV